MNYSPSCRSKPIKPLFIFRTQMRINPSAFWPFVDSNATTKFKAQKGSKDIVKIVRVTLLIQYSFYEVTINTFCVQRKQKQRLYSAISSVFDARLRQHRNAFMCIPLLVNKAEHIRVLRQNASSCVSSTACMCHGTLVHDAWEEREEIVE